MAHTDNAFTYLKWRGDLSIEASPFNEVDALILSELSYIELDGIVGGMGDDDQITIQEANERYAKKGEKYPYYGIKEELFDAVAKSPRFAQMTISNYKVTLDLLEHQQFAAMHFNVTPYLTFIGFRGTDSTIAGWREDFNMSYMMPVPAQQSAVDYVNETAKGMFRKYWIGGHSKGGNLAIYSSVFCEPRVQKKIIRVNSFDGPGFNRSMIDNPSYLTVKERIHAYVPDESVVGMLMEHEEEYRVVKSSAVSLLQHEGLSWQVNGTEFVLAEGLDNYSKNMSETIKSWLARVTPEERKMAVNAFFTLFEKAGLKDFVELKEMDAKTTGALLKAVATVPKKERELVGKLIKLFIEETTKK